MSQLTDFQIFMIVILGIVIVFWSLFVFWFIRTAKLEPQLQIKEPLVTEHRILLNHKIASIMVEEDEVFFIYE